jgi:hypothetical protein
MNYRNRPNRQLVRVGVTIYWSLHLASFSKMRVLCYSVNAWMIRVVRFRAQRTDISE